MINFPASVWPCRHTSIEGSIDGLAFTESSSRAAEATIEEQLATATVTVVKERQRPCLPPFAECLFLNSTLPQGDVLNRREGHGWLRWGVRPSTIHDQNHNENNNVKQPRLAPMASDCLVFLYLIQSGGVLSHGHSVDQVLSNKQQLQIATISPGVPDGWRLLNFPPFVPIGGGGGVQGDVHGHGVGQVLHNQQRPNR